jgi:aminopeptidase N
MTRHSIATRNENRCKWLTQLLCNVSLILLSASAGCAPRRERFVDAWRPVHYDVALSFDDQLTQLTTASTDVTVEVLAPTIDRVDLDFGELPIDSLFVSGATVTFERTSQTLIVRLAKAATRGTTFDITVNYHGVPQTGLIFAKDGDGKMSATGDSWPDRVHYWIPSLDHPSAKATVSFAVSAPQRYHVIANGQFITHTGTATTSLWKYDERRPIPPYCMMVAVNEGAIITPTYPTTTSLLFNVPQRDRDYAPKGFAPAEPALAFFRELIAPYPYEKLALIVGATRFGGMENSSAIVFASNLFHQQPKDLIPGRFNRRASVRFGIPTSIESGVAHEIAHQWFGDSVTESTWADVWLSEGFATYFAALFIEHVDGEEAFQAFMQDAADRYFTFEKQARVPIHDTKTTTLMGLLNPNSYDKGAWVLHMLRRRLGDDVFFNGLRDYYRAHESANASTEDLREALERASGKELKGFFARWVYGSGHPIYRLRHSQVAIGGGKSMVTIELRQIQKDDAFLDPVVVELAVDGKKQLKTIIPTSKVATLSFEVDRPVTDVQIGPDDALLKEVVMP